MRECTTCSLYQLRLLPYGVITCYAITTPVVKLERQPEEVELLCNGYFVCIFVSIRRNEHVAILRSPRVEIFVNSMTHIRQNGRFCVTNVDRMLRTGGNQRGRTKKDRFTDSRSLDRIDARLPTIEPWSHSLALLPPWNVRY